MTQRAAASLYRGISSEVALLRQPGRATTPATGRTRVNARFTALDRVQGRSETRDQSQKRPHRTLTSATATNPSFSRIGRDMAPACTVSAGVRRATADALRAERDFWRRQFLLGLGTEIAAAVVVPRRFPVARPRCCKTGAGPGRESLHSALGRAPSGRPATGHFGTSGTCLGGRFPALKSLQIPAPKSLQISGRS